MRENNLIRAWRERQSPPISQEEAGKRVGVTRFTWMRWESGAPVEIKRVPDVSRETGIPARDIRPDIAGHFLDEAEAAQ
jgi:DNA-binding XRE family transcriptional regulator